MDGLNRREFAAGVLGAFGLAAAGCASEAVNSRPADSTVGPTSSAVPTSTSTPTTTSVRPEPLPVGLTPRYSTVTERVTSPGADGVAVNAVTAGLNQFALDAYAEATASAGTGNVLLGNYSLATALALTLAGMAGSSRTEMASMLHVEGVARASLDPAMNAIDLILQDRATEGLDILTANRLFVAPGLPLVDAFLDTAVGHYNAAVTEADFANEPDVVVDAVNEWVAEQTGGFIDELVESFDPNTVISLVNAVYLKARWGVSFSSKDASDFTTATGDLATVPMFGHDDYLPQFHDDEVVAFEMPYVGGNLSMVVIMPTDLDVFEQSLSLDRFDEVVGGLQEQGIHLTLPKWNFEQEIDGIELLSPLGLPIDGDFSSMFEGGESGYFISQINHKARIEVDETGTTAAAASNVAVASSHGPTIFVNRPYFYAIRDRGSGTILFIGRVTDPTQTS